MSACSAMGEIKKSLSLVRRAAATASLHTGDVAVGVPQSAHTAAGLDDIDFAIIRILQDDGRAAFTTIESAGINARAWALMIPRVCGVDAQLIDRKSHSGSMSEKVA